MSQKPVALVTGASSGIGKATTERLASEGFLVYALARRQEKLEELAEQFSDVIPLTCDVTDDNSVKVAIAQIQRDKGVLDLLINNAGGAVGLGKISEEPIEHWEKMFSLNVLGSVRLIQQSLPLLRKSEAATILHVTSLAAYDLYAGGFAYNAAKFAQKVLNDGLRQELLEEEIRVLEIAPGAVHTEEFSLNRFDGDQERAEKVYDGYDPLLAEDIADAIIFMVTRKHRVSIKSLRIQPTAQLDGYRFYKK